jgi:hypothetical protein
MLAALQQPRGFAIMTDEPAETRRRGRRPGTTTSEKVDQNAPAFRVINGPFGGLTRFCDLTGFKLGTAHGWLVKGLFPSDNHAHILAVAERHSLTVTKADLVPDPALDLDLVA